MVQLAYIDTEGGPAPPAIGAIKGTPTIKAFVPKRSSARNEKEVVEYDAAREVGAIVKFATTRMPSYVETIAGAGDLSTFMAKAAEWGLPTMLVFSNKAGQTSSLLKALSAEFRRRVLIGDLRESRNLEAVKSHRIKSFPSIVCLQAAGKEPLRFEGKQPTYHRLHSFASKCALRKAVTKKPAVAKDMGKDEKEEL